MQPFPVSHVICLNSNFVVFIRNDDGIYTSNIVELTDTQYDGLRGFVENGGYGQFAVTVNDVLYQLIHSAAHTLKYVSAEFGSMRTVRRLGKSATYHDILEADRQFKLDMQRTPVPSHLRDRV